jgi:2'-5' RNA ligase
MHRLFVAIRLPAPVADLLLDTMEGFAALRWQDAVQLHLTLRFVGEVERPVAEDLAAALGAVAAERFTLRIVGVGRFDHRNRGTLWAGVEPRAPVAALAAKVERACIAVGLAAEQRAYHPHVTLARWGAGAGSAPGLFVERHAALHSPAFEVAAFTLFESHLGRDGAHHEAIADYPLRAT